MTLRGFTTALAFGASRRRARGFTLLELLLTIGIVLLLGVGMFAFYDFALRSRDRAQSAGAEAQMAQAILDRMAGELSSVSGLTSMIRARVTQRGFAVTGQTASTTPEGGLVGSADSVSFLSTRLIPPSRFAVPEGLAEKGALSVGQGSAEVQRPPLYDICEVRWWWSYDAGPDAVAETPEAVSGGLYRSIRPAVMRPAVEQQSAVDAGVTGGEEQADPGEAAEPSADEQAEADPLTVTELIDPAVQWVHLRYFDGANWLDSYDGGASGPSPLAVEITLSFSPLLTQADLDSGKTVADKLAELFDPDSDQPLPPRTFRRVVYLSSGEMNSTSGVRMQRR